ncbi:MAG: ATP-binding domain-containing protein, partial [Aeromicrobium sp.]
VGPSGDLMNYIARVLPSLGDTRVTRRSLGEVVAGIRAARHDESVAAAAKGSSRMTGFLTKAAAAPMPGAPTEFRYFYKDDVLRLHPEQLDRIRRQLLNGGKRNRAYARAPQMLVDALWRQVRGERALEKGQAEFVEIVTTDDRFVDFVEDWWPPVEPIEIWRTLPDVIDRLSQGTFSRVEVEALKTSWAAGEPSIQDVPLIDELRYLVGEVPEVTDDDDDDPKQLMSFERRERDERVDRFRSTQSIEDDGFAHVLVDEAQDLSPMQWRMLGRRGRHASWTIVGDEAQSSWPHPRESAAARKAALDGKPEHAFRLSTNYRNSAEIYELAAKVAAVGVPDPDLADAVRRTGEEPRQLLVEPAALVDAARDAARDILGRVEGTVAVVAPRASVERLRADLTDLVAEHDDRLKVLDGLDTKGLEFDGVVVVEPDGITDESSAGWRTLYVVLTRATQLLTTVGTTGRWRQRIS